jgi:hypothetical protein
MISIDRLTLPVFEAAVVGCVRSSIEGNGSSLVLSEQSHRETVALIQLCQQSAPVQEILQGLLDFLDDSNATTLEKLNFIFRQSFIFGWHARGAIEEDERLQQLMH